jgi:hypothetical protein
MLRTEAEVAGGRSSREWAAAARGGRGEEGASVRSGKGEGGAGGVDAGGEAEALHGADGVPVEVDFVPQHAVARGNRVGVMVVVPAVAEGDEGEPPVVGGGIARVEAARSPDV